MTAEKSSSSTAIQPTKKPRVKHHWTDTNSDAKCRSGDNFLEKLIYRVSLHNGGYMLNKTERFFLNVLVWTCLILIVLYASAFMQGFIEGVQQAKTKYQG